MSADIIPATTESHDGQQEAHDPQGLAHWGMIAERRGKGLRKPLIGGLPVLTAPCQMHIDKRPVKAESAESRDIPAMSRRLPSKPKHGGRDMRGWAIPA